MSARKTNKVGEGGRDVTDAPLVTLAFLIFDERTNLVFQVAPQKIILQQNPVLRGLVVTKARSRLHFISIHLSHLQIILLKVFN